MNESERWERLRATLQERGVDCTVSRRAGIGGAHFIAIRVAGGAVEVHDRWWHKNANVWIGYVVHREDREGITRAERRPSKKRSEVAASVIELLEVVRAA